MPRKIEQVNELLLRELGALISREIPMEEGFISLSYVKCSPDLQSAKIGFSVLPDIQKMFALNKLKKMSSLFAKELQKKTRLHHIPKFNWIIDESTREADEMEDLFDQIKS